METVHCSSEKIVSVSHLDGKHCLDRGDSNNLGASSFPLEVLNATDRKRRLLQTNNRTESNKNITLLSNSDKSKSYNTFKRDTAHFRCPEGTFRVHKIFGDGNCMFRAISYILWRNEDEHRSLRTIVVQHIRENWREYSPFVMAEWSITNAENYYEFMSSVGTFASELECIVATKIYHMNLSIYREINEREEIKRVFCNRISTYYPTARLLFSGRAENGHYDVLLPC